MEFIAPSPDFNLVKIKFAASNLDGTPSTGVITFTYSGGVQLDRGATPVAIFPTQIIINIKPKVVEIEGKEMVVGYAEAEIPASNDPDIDGGGGTYQAKIAITGGGVYTSTFIADYQAPDDGIWLSELLSVESVPGIPTSVVTYDGVRQIVNEVVPPAVEDKVNELKTEVVTSIGQEFQQMQQDTSDHIVSVLDKSMMGTIDKTVGTRIYIKDTTGTNQLIRSFTGLRDISGSINNNWQLGSGGLLQLSREGNIVTLIHKALIANGTDTTVSINALPPGFRPTTNITSPIRVSSGAWSGALNVTSTGQIYCSVEPQNINNAVTLTWTTKDNWPSTLPGVAV